MGIKRKVWLVSVAILGIVSLLLTAIFLFWSSWDSFQKNQDSARAQSEAISLSFSAGVQTVTEDLEQLMTLVSMTVSNDKGDDCSRKLKDIQKLNNHLTNIGVVDSQGKLLCSALPGTWGEDYSNRLFYQNAVKYKKFVVGGHVIGSMSGMPTVSFGLPSYDQSGKLTDVVFAGIASDFWSSYESSLNLPKNVSVFLLSQNGDVLAGNEKAMDNREDIAPLFAAMIGKDRGTFVRDSFGVTMVYSFVKYAELGTYVASGMEEKSLGGTLIENTIESIPFILLIYFALVMLLTLFFRLTASEYIKDVVREWTK